MKDLYFDFSNLSGFKEIVHGISTREFGDMRLKGTDKKDSVQNRERFCDALGISLDSVVMAEIVHSNRIAVVGQSDRSRGARTFRTVIEGADGLITNEPGVNLMVTVADCLPIMAYDPVKKVVGIAHAGWRGVIGGIASQLIVGFRSFGSSPENIIIGIGPSICQKHFVVKSDVRSEFLRKNSKAVFVRNNDGYVDLKKCVFDELIQNGVSKVNLEVAKECTICNNYYFSSFRADKEQTIFQAAIIGLRG